MAATFKTTIGFTVTRQDGTSGTKTVGGLNTAPILTPPIEAPGFETMDDARALSAKNLAETIIQLITSGLTGDTYAPSYYQERRQFADVA